jgi:hypothetical protein
MRGLLWGVRSCKSAPLPATVADKPFGNRASSFDAHRVHFSANSATGSMEIWMLKDGKYSVWMRTPLAEGTGVVTLAPDGKLSGRDAIMSYTGHWRVEGEQFEANVSAVRHSTGPGAFGTLDKIDVTVIGLARGGVTASCEGTAKQAPGLKLEATLVRMADGQISPARRRPSAL